MEERIAALLRPEYVAEAASRWGATGAAALLDDVTNLVFEFKRRDERRILRFTHSSHHSEDEIIAELDWVNFLIRQGVPACRAQLSRDGQLTECYPVENGYFVATVFEYAPGHFIDDSNPLEWNPPFFQRLGRTVGRIHHATKQYDPRHLKQKRSQWFEDDTLRRARDYLPSDQQQAASDLEELLALFNQNTPALDSYGLVHCDLNTTNFHVEDGQIRLFDFDDCAYNWFINDLAVIMPMYSERYTEAGWEARLAEFFQCFMRGYREENQLDEFWLEYLPASLRLQNIIALIACYQADIPNSRYRWFYELVLKIYQQGHPIFAFDFRKAVEAPA
jgi:Ser/Thr protein kinase RdoA (MazF antagonist)